MGLFGYINKVKRIQSKAGLTEYFTPAEIVVHIVNLWDAKQKLSSHEFFCVNVLYELFKKVDKELCLTFDGYFGACNDIIAHFDLVAPYYQYCGSDELSMAVLFEPGKISYRERAKKLFDKKLIFKEEWMELHDEFMEKFWSM